MSFPPIDPPPNEPWRDILRGMASDGSLPPVNARACQSALIVIELLERENADLKAALKDLDPNKGNP